MGLKDFKVRLNEQREMMKEDREVFTSKDADALDKYGLDIGNYSADQIKSLNAKTIRKIRDDMRGNGLLKASLTLGGSITERATLGYLSALVEQNWILIRQNEILIKDKD